MAETMAAVVKRINIAIKLIIVWHGLASVTAAWRNGGGVMA